MAKRKRLRMDRVIIVAVAFFLLIACLFGMVKMVVSLFDNNEIKDNFEVSDKVKKHEDRVTIIIDPGHGGADGGTVNGDLYEEDIVLKIGHRVKQKLSEHEYIRVVMTRETDMSLGSNKDADLLNRAKFSEQYGASYFVSIHVNSYENTSINGMEIYKKDEASDEIANSVMKELMNLDLAENRGIFDHSGLMVLRKNTTKSILIETGYISGEDYEYLCDDNELMRIADAIAKGILNQLESDKKE